MGKRYSVRVLIATLEDVLEDGFTTLTGDELRDIIEDKASKEWGEMKSQQVIEAFGKVSIQFIVAMSMQADNMQRYSLGQSMAYSEEQFGVVIDAIEKLIKKVKPEPRGTK